MSINASRESVSMMTFFSLKFFAKVSPPCMAHSSAVRHDVVTIPNRPMNPPNHLPLSSLAMPSYPANPEFCIKDPSVLILMYPGGGNDQLM
ncbi:hypothetical protein RDI58_023772 [Solanum bulbocastanum]|uniref:Uncharacterized protein n=1 Tax=Solanum bulbocastanum TaxID=147425 RepID=A0AAN8Y2B7_SOLBU